MGILDTMIMKKFKSKNIIYFIPTFFLILFLVVDNAFSAAAAAQLAVEDDYENGVGQWDHDTGCISSTVKAHGGTHSMQCTDASSTLNLGGTLAYQSRTAYRSFWAWIPSTWNLGSDSHGHFVRNFGAGRNTQLDCLIGGPPATAQYLTCEEFSIPKEWATGTLSFETNSWHHFEYYFDQGDPNVANGIIKIWMDGTLVLNVVNEVVRKSAGDWLTEIQMPSNLGMGGNPPDNQIWLDQFELWTGCPDNTLFSGKPSCSGSVANDNTPPSQVTGLAASASSSSQINLNWNSATDSGGSGLVGYKIYRCQGATCSPTILIVNSTETYYQNTQLSAGTTYRYKVAAFDLAGNIGTNSTVASATTQATQISMRPIPDPLYGVTVDDVSNINYIVESSVHLSHMPTTRIVFDAGVAASSYVNAVNQIQPVSYIMGELLDSSALSKTTLQQYHNRTASYLTTLGSKIDIWEVGNEVNGNWNGAYADVSAKIFDAHNQVKAAGKRSELTLWYNAGCGNGLSELDPIAFTQRYVPADMRNGLDYVTISYYETLCGNIRPSAATLTTFFGQLHLLYPNAKLGFGEIGFPNQVSSNNAEAASMINYYYGFQINVSGYIGGYFWWYYYEDMLPYTSKPLWQTLNSAVENMPNYPQNDSPTILTNGQPSGTLPSGTTTTTMSLTTNQNANCKYSTTANVVFSSMSNTFTTTGGTTHSTLLTGLASGNSYTRYVRCQDTSGNVNMNDYLVTFSVANPTFDFSLTNGAGKTITQGQSTTNTITATLSSVTTQFVSFSSSGFPSGATSSFSPVSCSPTCTTTITINTINSTPTGNYTINVNGIGGGLTRTTNFRLTVNPVISNTCPWDLFPDGSPDGTITLGDILFVLKDFGRNPGDPGYNPKENFNTNPQIDLGDILTVLAHYGNCPTK